MEPFFIETPFGSLFILYHPPKNPAEIKRNILFIPPFAEELNRSRQMINHQARAFAAAGYGVLVLDLYGTGDSEGSFGEATVPLWQQNILAGISWLRKTSDSPPILWAMRSGALLAADLVQQHPEITDQLILWSPVANGKKFIHQYLRIKLAADLTNETGGQQHSLKGLTAHLEAGHSLEIAGYSLSPALAHGLSALALDNIKLPRGLSVKWIDISPIDPPELPPAARKVIDIWKNQAISIAAAAVNDPPFWTLQEPESAEAYIDQTLNLMLG